MKTDDPGNLNPSNEKGIVLSVDGKEIHLGYSRLSSYLECPRRYKYTYIDKLPQPPSEVMDRGTAYHNTLEVLLDYKMRKERLVKLTLALEAATHFAHEAKLNPSNCDRVRSAVEYYYQTLYPLHSPLAVERSFEIVRGGIKITGRIDLLEHRYSFKTHKYNFKQACTTDHKFSFDTWAKPRAKYGSQPIIYQWAFEDIFQQEFGLEYGGFNYNIIKLFPRPDMQILRIPPLNKRGSDWFEEHISEVTRALVHNIYYAKPSETACQYCAFKKQCEPVSYTVNETKLGMDDE